MGLLAAAGLSESPLVRAAPSSDPDLAADRVDPYFLQSGDLNAVEQAAVERIVDFQERELAGEAAVRPRGRPALAPTYRVLNWDGDLEGTGRFQGPLSLSPALPPAPGYQMNAQILGLHVASDDWGRGNAQGTLSVEFRTRLDNEPVTWLFAQQFDVRRNGRTNVGLEYVGQRNGTRDPIVSDEPAVDLRIQLMRNRRGAGLLRKVLQVFSFVVGLPTGGITGSAAAFAQALPVIRVPRLLREGVAFSQALFGGVTDESPIWRGGFTTFSLAPGGGRLALTPGLWVIMDEAREVDLREVVLRDLGGSIGMLREGKPVDANYLVLSIDGSVAELSGYGRVVSTPDDQWIEKDVLLDQ
jgi:hypothetical protein